MSEYAEATLEVHTRIYWDLSKTFHGRATTVDITVAEAITLVKRIREDVPEDTQLWKSAASFWDRIISAGADFK